MSADNEGRCRRFLAPWSMVLPAMQMVSRKIAMPPWFLAGRGLCVNGSGNVRFWHPRWGFADLLLIPWNPAKSNSTAYQWHGWFLAAGDMVAPLGVRSDRQYMSQVACRFLIQFSNKTSWLFPLIPALVSLSCGEQIPPIPEPPC